MNIALAKEVKKRILAEPKSVNMSCFLQRSQDRADAPKNYCGTVGCIAGHTLLASGISMKNYQSLLLSDGAIETAARGLLNISEEEADQLFYFFVKFDQNRHPYKDLAEELLPPKEGSKAYAKVVVKALERCAGQKL